MEDWKMQISYSAWYRPLDKIYYADLFDGRLEKYGIHELVPPDCREGERYLDDGRNYVVVYVQNDGSVEFKQHGALNLVGKIFRAVSAEFKTRIVSEHQHEFWGFETQEEWEACIEERSREDEDKFYGDLLKYLRGEAHDIRPGTVGECKAEIAKNLVNDDPTLMTLENKRKLLSNIEAIYSRDHAITVTLNEQDIAAVQMIATDEDDLPFA